MAQFKWNGEIARTYVASYGLTTEIRVPKKDGTWQVITAPGGFGLGSIIRDNGTIVEFTDERSLRVLRADPRYVEVV